MQTIDWIGFAVSNALTKTVVHFLPGASGTNAPYPVNFGLTLYTREGAKTITLDGGRLGQPDGVRLEDVFPLLSDSTNGMMPLSIELSTSQPRIDLSPSHCVIEFVSAANSVRFYATPSTRTANRSNSMLAVSDAFNTSSLFLVNCGETPVNITLLTMQENSRNFEFSPLPLPPIEPKSVLEYPFDEKYFSNIAAQECSWGLLRANCVTFREPPMNNAVAYAIYRDTLTKRIISVATL